jgi:hypothetical protein
VSRNTAGGPAINNNSSGASVSADGRFVAFEAGHATLAAGDTNGALTSSCAIDNWGN